MSEKSYKKDKETLDNNLWNTVELLDSFTGSKVLVSPTLQGRVITSTLGDKSDISFGWLNHKLIESRIQKEYHNPFGGEERLWIGPEGGKFSYYFQSPDEQTFSRWSVPGILDNANFYVKESGESFIKMTKQFELRNAIGSEFLITVDRDVVVVQKNELCAQFGIDIEDGVQYVGYKTANTITNNGDQPWNEEYGMPSVWMIGMYVSSPKAVVILPYIGNTPKIVTDYFGPLPPERLHKTPTAFLFKADGRFRSKIGLPKESTNGLCGCFDPSQQTLSVIKTEINPNSEYMNAVWGKQDSPFGGDAVNAYNDGPTETGYQMGPFLELEASSPGLALSSGESHTHTHYTLHLKGSIDKLTSIISFLFGLDVSQLL